ncbi:MAG: YDG domain-containing protein [Sphingomonas phyllosphaerae]
MAVGAMYDGGAANVSSQSGAVYLFGIAGSDGVSLNQTYALTPADTVTVGAAAISAQLASGTAVTLQASNDITVNKPITVFGTPSSVGALTLQAGRSILLNASITTKGGNVGLIANDLTSYGVIPEHRDAGRAVITMAAGTAIDAGTAGNVNIGMLSGVSSSNLLGDITLNSITGKAILITSGINYSGNAIILNSGARLTASDTGFALDLMAEKLTNNAGAAALSAPNGYWQVWTNSPTGDYVNGLPFDFKTYNAAQHLVQDAGKNGLIYLGAPTLTATLGAVTKTYDGTTAATLPAGAVTCTVCAFTGDAVTGYGADTITGYTSTTGTFNSKDVGAGNKTVTFRKADVAITATSNGKPVYGYRLSSNLQNTGSTIATAPLSVTATAASKTYDGTAWSGGNGVTYAGFVNGETDAVLGGTLGYAGTAQGATNAGSYAITPNGLTSSNYAITFVDGALTVNKAALALVYTANAATSVYGATPATLGGTVTGTGFVPNESVTDLGGAAVWASPVATTSAAGTYGITGSGVTSGNYTITASQAAANSSAYTVTKAALTVTGDTTTHVYTGAAQANGFTTSGLVNDDTVTGVSGLASGTNAGTYADSLSAATGTGLSNYTIAYTNGALTITRKALSIGAPTIADKVYDGTTAAGTLTVGSLSGLVGSETLSVSGAAAALSSKDVGSYTTTVGYTLNNGSGSASNYTLAASTGVAAAITAKALTIGAPSIADKVYNGTTAAGVLTVGSLSGLIGSETLSVSGAAAALSSKDVGSYTTTVGYTLNNGSGSASNYTLAASTGVAAAITAKALTIGAPSIADKVYNGTTAAGVLTVGSLSGLVGSETLSVSGAAAALSSKDVGSYTTTVGYTLNNGSGSASNYTLAASTGVAAAITAKALTIGAPSIADKVYNGTTAAGVLTVGSLSGLIGSETLSVSGAAAALSSKDVGSYTTTVGYTLNNGSGSASNYTLAASTGVAAKITAAALSITGAAATSKTYDGNIVAALVGGSLSGVVSGETVNLSISGASGTFAGKDVGIGKAVTATGYTISGTAAGNYTLVQPTGLTADITAKALTITGTTIAGKAYDGTTTAGTLTLGMVTGFVDSEAVTVTGTAGALSDKNAGTRTASVSYALTGGTNGGQPDNYTLAADTVTTTVSPRALSISGTTLASREYDRTTTAGAVTLGTVTDWVGNERVTVTGTAGALSSKNIRDNPTATVSYALMGGTNGGQPDNYTLASQTVGQTLTPKALTIGGSFTAQNKTYDGTTVAAIDTAGLTLAGKINGDDVNLNVSGATGSFDSRNVAYDGSGNVIARTVTLSTSGSITGVDTSNYSFSASAPTATAKITPQALTLTYTADAAQSVYGTTVSAVSGTVSGNAFAAGEGVADLGGSASWTTPVTATTGVGHHAIAGSGLTSGNYTIIAQQAAGNATAYEVARAALTVTGDRGSSIYNGAAQTNGFTTSGLVNGDKVTSVSGLASGTNAGIYADSLSGASGTGLSNYTIAYTNGALTIDKRALTLTYTAAAATSVYGSAPASVTGNVSGSNFAGNETIADLGGSASWTTPVTATTGVGHHAIAGSGLTSGNYTITAQQAAGNATAYEVTRAALRVTATDASKTYDGQGYSGGNGVSYLGFVNGETDTVLGGTLSYAGTSQGAVNAGSYVITPNGLTASNYAITFVDGALVVGKAALTVTAKDASRTYDGQSWSGGNGVDYNGFVNHETDAVLGGALSYAGSAQGAVRAGRYGIDVSGLTSNNYAFTYVGGHLVVDPRVVALTGRLTATSKVYDAGVVATVDTTGLRLSNTVANDDVQLNLGGATGTFADRNVGTGKTVTLSTAGALTGRDAGNYTFITTAAPTATADITPATLAVSGVTAASRTYDATRVARLSGGSVTALGSDAVSLSTSAASGTFADKNVGVGKAVTATGYTISGVDAGNYTLEQPTGLTADVIKASLSVTGVSAASRIYDATTAASLSGGSVTALRSDTVSLSTLAASGTFADKHVGTGKAVTATGYTISGTDAGNYTLAQPTGLTADITKANLAVTGVSAVSRVYDATTAASLSGGSVTALRGDTVSLSTLGASGTFADKNVGSVKAVTATGYTISGTDSGNYTLVQPTGLTADITKANLAVTGVRATNRVYDATTAARLSGGSVSALGSDSVSLSTSAASGTFADKHVGTGKAVTATGYAISGTDAGNYTLVQPTGLTATITPMALSVAGVTVADKVYDATTAATVSGGSVTALAGDAVTLVTSNASGAFADKNAGVRKAVDVSGFALSGADAGNYTLLQPIGLAAAINARTLSVAGSFSAQSKVYDATTNAAVDARGLNLLNAVARDDVRLNLQGASGTFADKNVGSNKVVTLSLAGALAGVDAANYRLATATASSTAAISPASLAVTGVATINKVYDATDVVWLTGGSVQALGRDAVSLVTAGASGRMNDKNVGTAKAVTATGYALSGADAGNYAIVQPVGLTVDVARAGLMVRDMTITKKTYDATAGATVAGGSVQPLGGDDVRLNTSAVDARFADKNAGSGKAVRVSGLTLTGTDALNYEVLAPTNLVGEIEPARLAVVGAGAQGRAYDASTVVGVSGGSVTPLGSDIVSLNATHAVGALADKNAGAGKTVTVSGFTLSGADAANYTVVQPGGMTVDITPASLSISGITAVGKVYDGSTSVALTGGMVTALGPDIVALVTTGATANFDSKNVGANKAVTVSGYALTGPDAGNYSLVQPTGLTTSVTRLASVTWTGKGDGKNWFDPANWAGGAIPDGSNVADVVLPAATKLTFDSTQQVSIDRLVTSPDADTVPSGTDTVLDLLRGNLVVDKDLTIDTLVQRGGGLTGAGSVTVLDSFTQTGGSIVMKGDVSVYQGSGDLETLSVSGRDITLTGTQAVRVRDTNASRDLTIVAGGDAVLGGPTKVGRNLSVTAGQSGTGAITQDQYVTVSGDAVVKSVGDITLSNTGNHFGGTVSCTSTSGKIAGACTSGGAIDQLRGLADKIVGRAATVGAVSAGRLSTSTGTGNLVAGGLVAGSTSTADVLTSAAPAYEAPAKADTGRANAGAAEVLSTAPTGVTSADGAGRMLADTDAMGKADTTYVTARFDEKDDGAAYHRVLPRANLGDDVYYVGN